MDFINDDLVLKSLLSSAGCFRLPCLPDTESLGRRTILFFPHPCIGTRINGASPGTINTLVRQGWLHLQLQRPLAAWATWQRVLQTDPDNDPALKALDHLENLEELPALARAVYRFQNPSDPERRKLWDLRLRSQNLGNLEDAAAVFQGLAEESPEDADAFLNLALCLAWLGRNSQSIDVLNNVVSLLADTAPERAADAWSLAEVLRFGAGAEHLADDLRCAWTLVPPNLPDPSLFQCWPNLAPVPLPVDPLTGSPPLQNASIFDWLDRPILDSPGGCSHIRAAEVPRKLASVIHTDVLLKLTSPDPNTLSVIEERENIELELAFQTARRDLSPLPIAWADAALSTFRIPENLSLERHNELTRELVERYHENIWIRQIRHGLDSRSPLEAARLAVAGDTRLRAKLFGIIRFREQLSIRVTHQELYQGYPFDRLRRRLGLIQAEAESSTLDPLDVTSMSETELQALDPSTLDDFRLVEALESVAPFLEDEMTARFALILLDRKIAARGRVESKILIAPLLRLALTSSDPTSKIERIESASSFYDAREAFTIRLWCAEVLARTNHPEAAFERYVAMSDSSDPRASRSLQEGLVILRENGHSEWSEKLLQ